MKHFSVTIDVETDWGGRIPHSVINDTGIRLALPKVIQLFNSMDIRATFFVSGCIIEKYKSLIIELKNNGHEIASHGYDHINYSNLKAHELQFQFEKSKDVIENIIDQKVYGLRVPSFQMNKGAFKLMKKAGYKYDSSVVGKSKLFNRYDYREFPVNPFKIDDIIEIPVSTMPFFGLPMGITWINIIGIYNFIYLSRFISKEKFPILYFHPFDLVEYKNHKNINWPVRLFYYMAKRKAYTTLETFIGMLKKKGIETLLLKDVYKKCTTDLL